MPGMPPGMKVGLFLTAGCAVVASLAATALGQSPAELPGGSPMFTAVGNEPGWRLEIGGGRMTLNADYGATTLTVPASEPVPVPGGRWYVGDSAGRSLGVTVLDGVCHDTMTGMPRPFTVRIEFDGRRLDGCGGEPASLLRGGAWVVESIDGTPVIPEGKPTIAFGDDGIVAGHASCNSYSGSFALTGEGLTISRISSTTKACQPPLMQQEGAVLAVLRGVMRYERPSDGTLVLHTAAGRSIRARRDD
jgi:heat shock protein HslJ